MNAFNYDNNLSDCLNDYKYQPDLTVKLDQYAFKSFTQEIINEIVLWKVNRYVELSDEILKSLNQLKDIKNGQHRAGESLLKNLLGKHGIDLPMASTFLRFYNPYVFQIIDRHAYRAVYDKNYPLYSGTSVETKIDTYFEYLDKLIELCKKKKLEFMTVDRLLYAFDKEKNGKL